MTDSFLTLEVEIAKSVATVRLNRPDKNNAFNPQMIAELTAAFDALGKDGNVRVVVLGGKGKSFSAGADLDWMKSSAGLSEEENLAEARKMAAMFAVIYECPKPTVARVHGASLGGGMGLVAACDIAVAGDSAVFGFTEVRLGIAPAVIAPYVIAKIGAANARRYFLSGERFDATEAMRIGLVSSVHAEDELDGAVGKLTDYLLLGAPGAQAKIKRLIDVTTGFSGDKYMEYTAGLIAELRTGEEGQAGLASFFEKREPPWAEDADTVRDRGDNFETRSKE